MIAFDRPTWVRPLNKKSTVFFTGQFFWHYLVNNPSCNPQVVAQIPPDRETTAPRHGPTRQRGVGIVGLDLDRAPNGEDVVS